MKTSFAKNVRLAIMKVVVTVTIDNLPNYFNIIIVLSKTLPIYLC